MKIKPYFLIVFLLTVLIIVAALIGRYSSTDKLLEFSGNTIFRSLILQIRLPRIAVSLLVGAGLAVSGLVMQTIFQNPLADPGVLGISQAAGFGASLGFLISGSLNLPIQLTAFASGILAMLIVLQLARLVNTTRPVALIFAGISVSALFSSGIGIIKYLADPLDQLPSIVFWLLGSLSTASWRTVMQIAPIIVACILILFLLRWRINAYALSDSILFSLGVKKDFEIYLILGISVLLTTTIISFSGLVGWVGLIIPNIAKLLFGNDLRKSLPVSIFIGAGFVLICDTIARAAIAGEIPLGIITAASGAAIFIALMLSRRMFA